MTTTATAPGHTDTCGCWRCCEADMAAFISHRHGLNPAAYGLTTAEPQDQAHATSTGGTGTGSARTRQATPKQVAYIKNLIASRDITGIDVPDVIEGISFSRARKLIDQLTAAAVVAPVPASDAQWRLINVLLDRKTGPAIASMKRDLADAKLGGAVLTSKFASQIITHLKTLPDAAPATKPHALVEPGMYVLDGRIFRVKNSRGGRLYASELDCDRMEFNYVCGAITQLKPEHRMSADEAARFGRRTGRCCVCARRLTRKESVAAGIGPICGGNI